MMVVILKKAIETPAHFLQRLPSPLGFILFLIYFSILFWVVLIPVIIAILHDVWEDLRW